MFCPQNFSDTLFFHLQIWNSISERQYVKQEKVQDFYFFDLKAHFEVALTV